MLYKITAIVTPDSIQSKKIHKVGNVWRSIVYVNAAKFNRYAPRVIKRWVDKGYDIKTYKSMDGFTFVPIEAKLEDKLQVGSLVKIGESYTEDVAYIKDFEAGDLIELVQGEFERDNGLYTVTEYAPSVYNAGDFDSIYHLFGNDLENFDDCKVLFWRQDGIAKYDSRGKLI